MKLKDLFRWFHEQLQNYNLFIPDENDYEDENDEPKDPIIILKQQRYATRLYVFLLIITLYILYIVALIYPQTRIITVPNITPSLFKQLRIDYGETLSCPCSSTTMAYSEFVSNTIIFHPVCSSMFVSQQWIEALYLSNASAFLVMDFRTIASSQFELLAKLCLFSQETVLQAQLDLNNTQLVTVELLSENEVQSQIDVSIEFAQTSTPVQATLSLHFLQLATRLNSFVSALNTNAAISVYLYEQNFNWYARFTQYADENTAYLASAITSCDLVNSVVPAGFYSSSYEDSTTYHFNWPINLPDFEPIPSAMVNGFFGGCNPLDALLASTLDCLFNISCLQLLGNYFPALSQANLTFINALSPSKHQNISLDNLLNNLLVEEWSSNIDYPTYFAKCTPKLCTYTEKDQTNISYMITLLLSLYGGLIIIFRLISVALIKTAFKFKFRAINTNPGIIHQMTYIQRFVQWIKQLNMFKLVTHKTPTDIKQQRITTRVYLILLAGSLLIFLLFTSLNTQTMTITESNPSLTTYNYLQDLYLDTLQCPCSNITMPYSTFVSLKPTLHQVCSSAFISNSWMLMMKLVDTGDSIYHGFGAQHTQLLSSLCDLANKTIVDAVHRFTMRSLATSNVLLESNFNDLLNTTLNQFTQSLLINFKLLINTSHLFTQVDQPFTKPHQNDLKLNTITDQISIRLNSIVNNDDTSIECICATNPQCQSQVLLPDWQTIVIGGHNLSGPYTMPGMIAGCFTIDSFLLSTLECFYSNFCLSILYYYMNETKYGSYQDYGISLIDVLPLVYESLMSLFPPNTSLKIIVQQMMVEQWNSLLSFDNYYETCSPTYCTYTQTVRTKTFVGVVITFVSTIGGLTVALRLITVQLIKFIFRIFQPKVQRQNQGNYK
ncbi:unnamed protein product [Adineta steineri]|uniref:Transmembrane protein n=1 Tax=Adineta steineri TaxID=433720 RepID=A0A818Y1T7_9BILA|nr:unnamed protein product [Adineta steineri]